MIWYDMVILSQNPLSHCIEDIPMKKKKLLPPSRQSKRLTPIGQSFQPRLLVEPSNKPQGLPRKKGQIHMKPGLLSG